MIAAADISARYTPEMALAILCCRTSFAAPGNDIRDFIAANEIDWQLFEQMITAHQVRPLVFKALSASGAKVPSSVLTSLRTQCFRIATDNMVKLEEMARLHTLLEEGGVPNVPYKGVILSQLLFGDHISRETSDIDFLIDKKHFGKAHELVTALGYKPRFYNPGLQRQFLATSHELLYRKNDPKGPVKLELHWAATSDMMNIPVPNEYLLAGLQKIQLAGKSVEAFSEQSHLLIVLVHHGVNDIWRSLRHVADIAAFVDGVGGRINWEQFKTATNKFGITHTSAVGFWLARELFGTAVPPGYELGKPPGAILNNLLTFPAIRKRKLNMDNFRQQLFLRDSLRDKLALLGCYLYGAITPNVRDMEAYQLPARWYFLYYIMKPFRMLSHRR